MTPEAYKTYLSQRLRQDLPPKVIDVPDSQIGSYDNPFDNINDACNFVEQEERKAYTADIYLRDVIEKEQYFFDGCQFRVEWASPHVGHIENNFPEGSFIVNEVERKGDLRKWYSLKPNLYRKKFLYRGQSKYYNPCKPNLFRCDKPNYLEDLIWSNELTVLARSHPMVKLFEQGIDLMHDIFRFSVNFRGLQQHYYNKTTLLDLTSDIGAAKFFAVTDYDSEKDQYKVHVDDGELGVLYYYDIQMPTAFRPQSNGIHLSVIGKQPFMRSGQQHGFLIDLSDRDYDFNVLPQVHKVFFHHDNEINNNIFEESNKSRLYFPDDLLEQHWNKYNKEYKKDKRVSFEAVKENLKYNPHETLNSLIGQLDDKGYKVDKSLHTSFDDEELHSYYEGIKNGLWSEFCKDIYFAGPENDLYREELLNVERQETYKTFFKQ